MSQYLRNLPIPESFVVPLLPAVGLNFLLPLVTSAAPPIQRLLGITLVMMAVGLAGWAVAASGSTEMAQPQSLIRRGPYRFSRNPMYLAWALLVLGIALTVNSGWVGLAFLVGWVHAHRVVIPQEEARLTQQFGDEYRAYRADVPRWL